jgi:type I restriction enzyme, S subunit
MKSGWQTSTLGDVLAVLRNGVNCKQDKSGKGDRISRIETISDASFDLEKVGYTKLSERDKQRYRLQPGDILFSHINSAVHVGKTAVFDSTEPIYHGVNLLLMRPKDTVTSAYLEHALKFLFQSGYWRGVCKQSVNQASVNQQDISRVEISYPKSLPEQQRIVGVLDEAFEGIATARANAEKNLQNARAVFESHLQSVFTQRGKGWVEKPIAECFKVRSGEFLPAKAMVEAGDFDVYGGNGVNGRHNQKNLTGRNIIIGRVGAKCGNVRCVEGDLWVTDNAFYISEYFHEFDLGFLARLLERKQLRSTANQAAQPVISYTTIRDVLLAYPSDVSAQKKMAKALDTLEAETQRLATLYGRKLAALEALKKSLLHQAFGGKL